MTMRVLFAITRGETGGAQRHLEVLGEGVSRRGHEVGVVTEVGPLAENASRLGLEVIEWRSITRDPSPWRDLRARRELRTAVKAFRPDVLALYSSKAGVLGRGLLTPGTGVTVFTCHHAPFGPGRQWTHRIIGRAVEQLTLRYVNGIITDGVRDMPMLRKLAPGVPIALIPNGVALPDGPVEELTTNAHEALWVARFRRPKDPLQAIRAWRSVRQRVPEATLHMCGEGPLWDEAMSKAAEHGGDSGVQLHGFVPSVRPYAAASSVFVLTSDVEGGITMATLEAMANGLVPVISDVGDAFMLEQERCGIVVPRRSPQSVAKAVIHLFENESERKEMRARAMAFSRETWTTDRLVESTLSFYDTLLSR